MAKVTIYDMTGKSVGERELNDAIFAVTPNKAVLHEVVKNYLANQRQGTQSTLTRTEVFRRRQKALASEGYRSCPFRLQWQSVVAWGRSDFPEFSGSKLQPEG